MMACAVGSLLEEAVDTEDCDYARNRLTNNNKHEKETDIHGTSYQHDHIRISLGA
jgi:hypothetical protein